MSRPSNILIASMFRNQRSRGPTFSNQINSFQSEVIRDLALFQQEWNDKIVPVFSLLPDGTDDSAVNAFNNGLDGRTLYVNSSATNTLSVGRFFNTAKDRPNTLYEQLVNIFTYIDDSIVSLQETIADNSSSLTTDQKGRIGINIFDTAQTSSTSSLDGKSLIHTGNILQIARDLYGESSPTLNTDGSAELTNSVKDMVDALLQLHSGEWDSDIDVNHSIIQASTSFRRIEFTITNLADNGTISLTHSAGMFPTVQVITADAIAAMNIPVNSVLPLFLTAHTVDHPGIIISHDSVNQITITNKLDEILTSAKVIIQW
jgi:hypothetical protein